MKFPFYPQHDSMDCGPACLQMVAAFHGRSYGLQTLRERCYFTRNGVSMLGISEAAESIGYRSTGIKATFKGLHTEMKLPCIVHWSQNHFVVVYRITKSHVHVADPSHGLIRWKHQEFIDHWCSTTEGGEPKGFALLLEPSPDFYSNPEELKKEKTGLRFLFRYLLPYRKLMVQLALGLLAGSLLQLIFPLLTQSIVDVGINTRNIGFIYAVLIAQLALLTGRISVEFIRSWILLHISARINIALISDFLIKLMKLPVRFFDTKLVGDLIQRIGDHRRIEQLLTEQTLSVMFSLLNLMVFSIVLIVYSRLIFVIFLLGSILYFLWIYLFMKRRRDLDFKRFREASANQSYLYQMITGMQEIKLQNCERQKRWEWERIQAALFRVSIKGLALNQYQQAGSFFINESKNILITILAATAVVRGELTLGMMLAVQYIIGQLNAPVNQLIGFMHVMQDARISMERLGEIHQRDDEEDYATPRLRMFPTDRSIHIRNLCFQYEGPHSPMVLNDVTFTIPENRTTAIVGMSGSGKTTLIKLLLGVYEPVSGEIRLSETNLSQYSNRWWRSQCGAVMQDGFIFNDTIARNIGISDEIIDTERLLLACIIANVHEFAEKMPMGYNTRIGSEGHGLSQGQKQRILIARAIYKEPACLFFDEATNSLDAMNEKVIVENLKEFKKGRTTVIVAHRLSTVKDADQIIVLDQGMIAESGTHEELVSMKGKYYDLVKNQLELGNA